MGFVYTICSSPRCRGSIVFLTDPAAVGSIPVNADSLSPEDRLAIQLTGDARGITFDGDRHARHRYTCKDPGRFSGRRGRK